VRRFIAILALSPLSLGVLASCGSDNGNTSKTGTASVDLKAADYSFQPTDLTLTAGQQATIAFKNDGSTEHNLTVEKLQVEKDVQPGKSAEISVTPEAGTYPFHCRHHPMQMKGTIAAT
jgi:plastocyanin